MDQREGGSTASTVRLTFLPQSRWPINSLRLLPDAGLSTEIPHLELEVLVCDRLHVKADGCGQTDVNVVSRHVSLVLGIGRNCYRWFCKNKVVTFLFASIFISLKKETQSNTVSSYKYNVSVN